jgi:hypothetical protein
MLGALVSTAFLACGPLIVNTVMDFALQHKSRSSLEDNGIIFLTTNNNLGVEANKISLDYPIEQNMGLIASLENNNNGLE